MPASPATPVWAESWEGSAKNPMRGPYQPHHARGRVRLTRVGSGASLLELAIEPFKSAIERDVAHYLREERRIDYGAEVGKKLRGQGKLDATTATALEAALGERTEGPLVLGPRGGRLDKRNLLR